MAEYRYLLRDVITGDLLGEVPFISANYSDVLNAPGSFSGTLGLQQPAKLTSVLRDALNLIDQGRLTLFVDRAGVMVWGGFLWTTDCDYDAGTCTLNGEGYLSYYRKRLILGDLTYTGVDQITIAKNLVDYANAAFYSWGGLPVVTTDVTASGVLRDRTYLASETKWVGESLEQLAAVEDGFDFRFEPQWASGIPQIRFLTTFPNTGRSTDTVFDLGTQVKGLRVTHDATTLANRVMAIGATLASTDAPLTSSALNLRSIGASPLYDDVVNFTDVSNPLTLRQHAGRRIQRGSTAIVIPSVDVDPNQAPTFGSYAVGDIVTLRGELGIESVNGLFRITERAMSVDDNGSESVGLSFANLEVFSS
jgi:hypothetical protein